MINIEIINLSQLLPYFWQLKLDFFQIKRM